jgi:glutamate-1-semialdehyde 2,1-aminomutase
MTAGLVSMRHLDHAAFAHLETLGNVVRDGIAQAIEKSGVSLCVTGAASLFRIHPTKLPPKDYREAYLTPGGASVMKELTRFFAANGIILPYGAAAALSTPMTRADADTIVEVFAGFLDGDQGKLSFIED